MEVGVSSIASPEIRFSLINFFQRLLINALNPSSIGFRKYYKESLSFIMHLMILTLFIEI